MNYINGKEVKNLIIEALREDLGAGDITTKTFIPAKNCVKAVILAHEPCVICGLGLANRVFKALDEKIKFKALVKEGANVKKGALIAQISGKARGILCAERVALNFLSHLSGIATKTRIFVKAVKPYKTKILDTRKTLPGLRLLQKYAVRIGGGFNHRFSLDEMVMLKDNHLKVLKGINNISGLTRKFLTEIEVKNLREFRKALLLNPDIIMLDNMKVSEIKKCVDLKRSIGLTQHTILEASGGITLKNAAKIASTGVDTISIGELTHSVESADISLEIL